jgi:putative ABC transport system permease protein
MLLDELTQKKCGPSSADGAAQIFQHSATVVGRYSMGVGFLGDGSVIVSESTFTRVYRSGHDLDNVHLGLVTLEPGTDPESTAKRLVAALPGDVRVMTRDELNRIQSRYWVQNTAVGNIFGIGTAVGFLVGMVVLYQILSTDIRNHLPLYATLRAMGYSNRRLYGYVLEQAGIFALLGFGPALAVAAMLFPILHGLTLMPIYMTLWLALFVLILSASMCAFAAILSLRRLRAADPADLF